MKHYGVIDIGSNTIRLVIYKWEEPELTALLNKKESAGLANYVDRDGGLSEAGICRAEQALAEFREILEHVEVERTYVFATASLRNISNTGIVAERLRRSSGFDIQVISGEEEADYDFRGALRATGLEDGLLVDVGGGSTEFVLFQHRVQCSAHSLRMGSLNLYTKYVSGILPGKKELEALSARVDRALEDCLRRERQAAPADLCAVGGSARAAAKLVSNLDPSLVASDGSFPVKTLKKLLNLAVERRHTFTRMVLRTAPERIHTIVPGLVILYRTAHWCGARRVVTSPYGVREGYLLARLEQVGQ